MLAGALRLSPLTTQRQKI